MLQQSFPAEIADIITGIIVYGSGLTTFLIYIANKYWFKNKNKISLDDNPTEVIKQQNSVASIDIINQPSESNQSSAESEDEIEGGN